MTREEAIKILEYPVKKWSMEWDEREDGLSYYEALDMAISALRQREHPQWFSVKDGLPETDELVLAVASGKPLPNITYDRAVVLASYDRAEGWIIEEYPEWDTPEVTHWMPLPDPPEEVDHA